MSAQSTTTNLHGTDVVIHESYLPVSLAPGEPIEERVFVRLTMPAAKRPSVVQMMSGPLLWNNGYWSVSDPREGTDRYHWTAHAVRAGYATLAIDRIGIGKSSRPPAKSVTVDSNVYVNYQVARALRAGNIEGPLGNVGFRRVVGVSQSFSSCFTQHLVSRHRDAFDCAVMSGWTHAPRFDNFDLRVIPNFIPTSRDDRFTGYPEGYMTSRWGTRHTIFFAPADSDHRLLEQDERETKATLTSGEMESMIASLSMPLDIRIPTLLAVGGSDPLFAKAPAPPGPHGTDCSSAEAMLGEEARFLGSNVPRLDGYVLPGSGHNLNVMPNAKEWFAFATAWIDARVRELGD